MVRQRCLCFVVMCSLVLTCFCCACMHGLSITRAAEMCCRLSQTHHAVLLIC